jgi:hypothetical protein
LILSGGKSICEIKLLKEGFIPLTMKETKSSSPIGLPPVANSSDQILAFCKYTKQEFAP